LNINTKISTAISILLLAGCSGVPRYTPAPTPTDTPQERPQPQDVIIEDRTSAAPVPEADIVAPRPQVPVPAATATAPQSPAVIALLDKADYAQQQGDFNTAQTNLQRAQRIAPRDPAVYYALANTHMQLEDYALAEQVALKGISITQGQPQQLKKFWLLVADIRLRNGDIKGSEAAQSTANRY